MSVLTCRWGQKADVGVTKSIDGNEGRRGTDPGCTQRELHILYAIGFE